MDTSFQSKLRKLEVLGQGERARVSLYFDNDGEWWMSFRDFFSRPTEPWLEVRRRPAPPLRSLVKGPAMKMPFHAPRPHYLLWSIGKPSRKHACATCDIGAAALVYGRRVVVAVGAGDIG